MFANGWLDLATWRDPQGRRLTGTTWTLFAGLMAHLDFENVIRVSQATLAKELGLQQPNVAVAVKRLEQAGFITRAKDADDPSRTIYHLNPNLGWRGDAGSWNRAIQARVNAGRTRTADEDIDAALAEHGLVDGATGAAEAEAASSDSADETQEGDSARRAAGVPV